MHFEFALNADEQFVAIKAHLAQKYAPDRGDDVVGGIIRILRAQLRALFHAVTVERRELVRAEEILNARDDLAAEGAFFDERVELVFELDAELEDTERGKHALYQKARRDGFFRRDDGFDHARDLRVVFAAEDILRVHRLFFELGGAVSALKARGRRLSARTDPVQKLFYLFDLTLGIVEKVDGVKARHVPVAAL